MLIQPTFDQLYKMRLNGMAEAFRRQLEDPNVAELSFEERFGLLVESHYVWKETRALTRRLSLAKLKVKGVLEDIDFRHPRGLDRARLLSLANESRWVRLKQNIVLVGPTGIGKSYIACALAHKACRDGYKALVHARVATVPGLAHGARGGQLREIAEQAGAPGRADRG